MSLKFADRDAFGKFCAKATEDEVPFSLAGFQTVVLASTTLEQLPPKSRSLFKEFKASGIVEVTPTISVGKRPPPMSRKEAEALLRKFAKVG